MALLVFDTFNGVAGTDLSAHTPDTDVIGGGWVDDAANEVELDGSGGIYSTGANNASRINAGSSDLIVTANINNGGVDNRFGVMLRFGNADPTFSASYYFNFKPDTGTNTAEIFVQASDGGLTSIGGANLSLTNGVTYEVECSAIGSNLVFKVDGVTVIDITDATYSTGTYAAVRFARWTNNTGRFYDFQVDDTTGGAIEIAPTLGTISYASQNTTVSITGSIDAVATLGTINYTPNNASVSITGSVDVITTLGTISYTSNSATVSITGDIDVSTTLGTIDYSSNATSVNVSGSIDIVTTLGAINYTSNSPAVDVGGVITAIATLGTIDYTSNSAVIGLTGSIDVATTIGAINYTSNNTTVSFTGLVDVNATLGTISYTSNNTTVIIEAGQAFGVVTVGFADDVYSSTFKPDSITVTFKN